MKRLTTTLLSVALLMMVGCKGEVADTPATISKDIIANMNAMAAAFNSVTDEASAKAAVPKIESIRANMRGVAARAKAMPKLSKAEMDKFDAEAAKDMPAVMETIGKARMKLEEVFEKNPEVRKIIEPALQGMENDM